MSDEALSFKLTEEETKRYFAWARSLTEAHVEADCEPPSCTFTFECCAGFTNINVEYCGKQLVIRDDF